MALLIAKSGQKKIASIIDLTLLDSAQSSEIINFHSISISLKVAWQAKSAFQATLFDV